MGLTDPFEDAAEEIEQGPAGAVRPARRGERGRPDKHGNAVHHRYGVRIDGAPRAANQRVGLLSRDRAHRNRRVI
ncbi:MAG TPA: hypothetical protein VNV66_14650 [Pilimelia sp.]|nr:hypothetical protein [Pilimelia sp.]